MGTDESGWADDDPEYLMARIRGIVDSMAAGWRGHPLTDIEMELRRRLSRLGDDWPPELVEHLVRHIRDPRWPLKHPLQALDLGRRFQRRAGELPG
ncbi:MAG: hypothetical protein ACRDOJ_02825 [Nocardioidaceae bacterium]